MIPVHPRHVRAWLSLITLSIGLLAAASAWSQSGGSSCGPMPLPGQYGPWDYRTDRDKLAIVLGAHFTPEVEALVRGKTSESPGGDISYTLVSIPNNHRALIAVTRLGEKEKTTQPKGSRFSVQCWFERAITFRPDDAVVRMIYSTYLNKQGRPPEANAQLEQATVHAKDNAFTHYNIGLHYFDMKSYDKALLQAHKAMALGFTQTALRDQLQQLGKWSEPPEAPPTPAAASSAPTAEPAK
ncbi:MAG: tetratricopeptide repeat protein [Gammaproteobacteria bacterium]|nr:tetratricopeptide repeat protein [Gammaproteobacteria bacterium]